MHDTLPCYSAIFPSYLYTALLDLHQHTVIVRQRTTINQNGNTRIQLWKGMEDSVFINAISPFSFTLVTCSPPILIDTLQFILFFIAHDFCVCVERMSALKQCM